MNNELVWGSLLCAIFVLPVLVFGKGCGALYSFFGSYR
jgi:hypothetical protein